MTCNKHESRSFHVLVVDDHRSARESIADVLRQAGYRATACAVRAAEALTRLAGEEIDVVITDLQMPGMDGLDFIREIQRRRLPVQVLMITAHASIGSAVAAMRHGAFDYLEKPFDVVKLEESVAQACDRRRLQSLSSPADGAADPFQETPPLMVGESAAMRDLRARLARIAATDETVLLCGESGTGKELAAQTIHALSRRANKSLVSLNCPVLSAQLTESELFGHKRGAFTGADTDRIGRFEMADGGTLVLDEITEIDLGLQAKLLRVLQERTFEKVGSSEPIRVDVRIVATTNRDLPAEIAAGRFREDLFYRLAVVPVTLPPLRERGGDVERLIDHYLQEAARRLGRAPLEIEPSARELLCSYHWPGNVRELQNIMTRACVLNHGEPIRASEIRPWLYPRASEQQTPPRANRPETEMTLEEHERRMIVATLERFGGHRARTAKALGIGIRTLSGKLRSYGFAPREKEFAQGTG